MTEQTLTIAVAAVVEVLSGEAAVGLVVRDGSGQVVRRIGKAIGPAPRALAAYRALLHALWRGRALGARRIRLLCDDRDLVAGVRGEAEVPPDLTGPYLQVRALLRAYQDASVEAAAPEDVEEAAAMARTALARKLRTVDTLPLWAARSA
ncbi:MAG: reverse transcriptase-like protein [Armatimonadetes bacterium]|nr:reverse transcriptase-like protein [Armatimonadota bacterium]